MPLSFRILGPLTAEFAPEPDVAPTELDPGPFKQRFLLGLLLCRCNSVVLVEQLIDTLWWDGPPRTAHKNIQVYVCHLRKLLAVDGHGGTLRYRPPGYQLTLNPAELDALRFEDLSRAGRLALRRGDAPAAASSMRLALRLWHGDALSDLRVSPLLRDEAARLDERRLAAYEDWFEAELLLGNDAEVLEEMEGVVHANPLRERLRSQQLTALYRGGRQAEALAEYDNLRQMLAVELGLDPSPALQRLYKDILSGQVAFAAPSRAGPPPRVVLSAAPRLSPAEPGASGSADDADADAEVVPHLADPPAASTPRPSGLPSAARDFTGRQDELAKLLGYFDQSHLSRFAAIVGPPGSGTSTLALRAAHALAPRFRDGAVMLPLRDESGAPRPTAELLDDALAQLEPFRGQAPQSSRDPAAALRIRLSGLQTLLILDNAADEAQVRPLLPGAGDCSVILTSCRYLGGLDGIARFPLGAFTEPEALDLLGRLIGAERVSRERPSAVRIVRACGLLPLAVRVAGARLAGLGHLPLERFASRLEDPERVLDELVLGDLSVREHFHRFLQGLDATERLALMQVAAAWGPLSRGADGLEQLLEKLADVHALTITSRELRPAFPLPFAMPRPLWIYAQQLLANATRDAVH